MQTAHSRPEKKLMTDRNLQIIFAITLMSVLGVSSITPAFPRIMQSLHISTGSIGLLITVFTLPGVLLTPVLGVMADRWGRKKILIPSLFLFGIAGFLCAFARTFEWLLLLRFLQGVGAASLSSLNVTIIGDIYSGRERGIAMGYNASVLSVGTASYPALGGLLALFGWYYPFYLPILALPVGLIVLFRLKNPEPRNNQLLKEYFSGIRESINLQVIGLFIASTVTFIILYGSFLTYFPILIGSHFGKSTFIIGVIMSAMSAATAITSSQLGRLLKRYSEHTLIPASFILYGVAMALVPSMPGVWYLLIPSLIFGIAHGVNIPSIQTMLAGLSPMEHRGAFMSINGMVLRLGQTLGPITIGLLYSLWGLKGAFFGGSGFAALMLVLGYYLIKKPAEKEEK